MHVYTSTCMHASCNDWVSIHCSQKQLQIKGSNILDSLMEKNPACDSY